MVWPRCVKTTNVRVRLAVVVLFLAGCGVPQGLPQQAEKVHSVAAEGALLAHEASEGSLDTFTREHAKALRKSLEQLQPAIQDHSVRHLTPARRFGEDPSSAGRRAGHDELAPV